MRKVYTEIHSPALGRNIRVTAYGHFGPALLVFPSAEGKHHDWEGFGMIGVLEPWIENGKLKVYTIDSNDHESWLSDSWDTHHRLWRHACWENFVMENLIPAIRFDCRQPDMRVACTGCSLGGFHAANFALKHPHVFHWSLAMSGKYNASRFFEGYVPADVYFNNPLHYTRNLWGGALEHIRRNTHIVLYAGQGAYENNCCRETIELGHLLAEKGISHELDIWGHDADHHWAWWRKALAHHIGKAIGNP